MHADGPVILPELGPDAYRRWRATEIGEITERLERELILDMVRDVDDRRILDVGCGDGDLACELAAHGANVTGVDSSVAMIKAARERSKLQGTSIQFQVAKAESLPFPADRFEVVTAITILCFVNDAVPVFREIARVLSPGGRLVIGELGRWSTWAAGRRIRAWLGSNLWRHGRFRTARELRNLAGDAGLQVEEVRGAVFYPRLQLAVRLLSPFEPALGKRTTFGAGFVALSAVKPRTSAHSPV